MRRSPGWDQSSLLQPVPMCRLLEWLPDVQEDVGWLREQILKVVHHVLRQASRSLSQHVSARWVAERRAPPLEGCLPRIEPLGFGHLVAAEFMLRGGNLLLVRGLPPAQNSNIFAKWQKQIVHSHPHSCPTHLGVVSVPALASQSAASCEKSG